MAGAEASDAQPANFAERLQRALAVSRHLKRERAIAGLVDGLDARQIPEASPARWPLRLGGPTGYQIRAELLNRWGALDHESALKYALASGELYDPRAYPVLFGWAEADEAAAESWAAKQEGSLQGTAWCALTDATAEVDPEHALILYAKIKDPYIAIYVDKIFGRWAQTAPAAAAARAEQMPHGFFRAEALALVAGPFGRKSIFQPRWLGRNPWTRREQRRHLMYPGQRGSAGEGAGCLVGSRSWCRGGVAESDAR